ncbi:pleckstrin homology domain-containing family S member 1 isoform X4 [Struthio camelus]|uniref:pleckstrin homology domain-containing family S member 1 isoform X4 n=1 Tax=Struthio camelus TaxID=8801 RepID=UPI0036041FF1
MASRNRRNSTGTQNTFYHKDEVCKYGFLTKSPPLQLLNSQNSWKRRLFVLSKSSKGCYTLKYLKGQNVKGSIAVDQIVNIEIGISNSERMATVRKMFKCSPEEVISISTGDRSYYLIGRSREEIKDWVAEISSVWREAIGGGCPQNKDLEKTKENPLSSDTDEDVKEEEEEYYKTPSNLLAKPDPTAEPNVPVQEKPVQKDPVKENVYMSMKALVLDDNHQLMCTSDGLPTPAKRQETSACPRDLVANGDLKLEESTTRQQPTLQKRQSSLPLSVVQLTILLSQITDETQLQKLDIFIPLTDINNYLTLTEAAGQICVSHWTGTYKLGCIFNHGDRIVAVNDLHPQNVEEVSLFISRSARKEVKLTVCRIPGSDIFHVKGCSCS